ncbi:MAG: hypothetical protein JRI55_10655 [Deltaproteobacteria bacterium]|nr:hypothetical protein [Deltaproteobacteria bacterium]
MTRVLRLSLLAVALVATAAVAAPSVSLNCPGGELFCFSPMTPAKASQINHNFARITAWLEQKVGTVGSSDVTVEGRLDVGVDAGVRVSSDGKLMVDELGDEYDLWIQGTKAVVPGDARNLAMVGMDEDSGDTLRLNPEAEYSGGIQLDSSTTVVGDLTVEGELIGIGGCYTHWGAHGCAFGFDEVVQGRSGGFECYNATMGVLYANVECVDGDATAIVSYADSTWTTRMMRSYNNGVGVQAVPSDCSVCCRSGCYTLLGDNTCDEGAGYSAAYTGVVGGVEAASDAQLWGKTLCLDDSPTAAFSWPSGFYTRLLRHRSSTNGLSAGMDAISTACAVCCK